MSKIKDDNYFQISGWMINRLNLKGAMLLVYAIIYGFSQDGECEFKGSRQYLCDFTGVTKPTIDKALDDLCKRNLIIKISETYNNVVFNKYKINRDVLSFTTSKEILPPSKETLQGGSKETLQGGSKETLPNNKDYNNNLNNNKDICTHAGKYGWIKLTQEQYDKLIQEHNNNKYYIDAMIQALDDYVQSNGNKNKYKDFNIVLRKAIKENWFNISNKQSRYTINGVDYEILFENDKDRYYEEISKLKNTNPEKAKQIIKEIEHGGFECL